MRATAETQGKNYGKRETYGWGNKTTPRPPRDTHTYSQHDSSTTTAATTLLAEIPYTQACHAQGSPPDPIDKHPIDDQIR